MTQATEKWDPRVGGKVPGTGGGVLRPPENLFFPLKPFQWRFVSAVLRPGITRAALSLPRGNGKSWLAGCVGSAATGRGAVSSGR